MDTQPVLSSYFDLRWDRAGRPLGREPRECLYTYRFACLPAYYSGRPSRGSGEAAVSEARAMVRRLEVAAMFDELAGYGRLDLAIDRWAVERREASRERFAALKADAPRYAQYLAQKRAYAAMMARAAGRKKQISDEAVRAIRTLCDAGVTQARLARQFGITTGSVSLLVRGMSRPEAGGPMRGERSLRKAVGTANAKSRLTEEAVAEVRTSHLTNKELGLKFGVHHSTIGAVRRGKSWTWMDRKSA